VDGGETGHALRYRLDHDAPSVGRVGDPSNVSGLLQAVDHPGSGPGTEARPLCEAPDGHGTFVVEELEALHVDGREPNSVGHGLAEEGGLAADLAGRPQHGIRQSLTGMAA
jgi:hypothetical protein